MQLIQINTEHSDENFEALSHIVHEMQVIFYLNGMNGAHIHKYIFMCIFFSFQMTKTVYIYIYIFLY